MTPTPETPNSSPIELPQEPPLDPIGGAACWRGQELCERPEWEYWLSDADLAEIRAALETVNQKGLALEDIEAADFPLPRLGRRLRQAQGSLENGGGAFFLRGWPASEVDDETNTRVYWGLARHLGTPVSQSAQGEKVFRVEDAGYKPGHAKARGPNTSGALRFHCDRCDVLGFLCVRPAKTGGDSFLVSSIAVHDEILARRPDLLRELYGLWYYKTHNIDTSNADPWCRQPIFALEQGHFVGYVLRVLIDRAYELPELPDMTERQKEALDFLDQVCADPALHFRFRQETGDILFVNNFTNFHSRSAFEDHEDPAQRRLILRIWLSVPNSRPLPASFAGSFGRTGAGEMRGGIHPPKS